MLSKAQIKHIRSLTRQKIRTETGLFTAEGVKVVSEWLVSDCRIQTIVVTEAWYKANKAIIDKHSEADLLVATQEEIAAVSSLSTPSPILLVIPQPEVITTIPASDGWYIALDDIQDPGNMGTIIRIADWFGVKHVICSVGCVDAWNPKVVQSAMGSHLRVNIYEADLATALPQLGVPVYAATLHGENVYDITTGTAGVLVIGNESRGISDPAQQIATHKVTIPRQGGAESLNAAVSAGILCALMLPR